MIFLNETDIFLLVHAGGATLCKKRLQNQGEMRRNIFYYKQIICCSISAISLNRKLNSSGPAGLI